MIDRSDAVNLARNMLDIRDCKGITNYGIRVLCEAVIRMDAALAAQPAQAAGLHHIVDAWLASADDEHSQGYVNVAAAMRTCAADLKRYMDMAAPVPAPVQAGEPVATLWREPRQDLYPGPILELTDAGKALPLGVKHKLYTHPAPPMGSQESVTLKDHQIRDLVNEVSYVATEYALSQQLRERIAHVLVPVLKAATPQPSEQELFALLPYAYYMDTPDGGSPTLLEQLQRMAKDAQRYRWLRANVSDHVPFQGWWRIAGPERPERLDEAIDAELVAPAEFKQEQP